jgi:hypothetical protein
MLDKDLAQLYGVETKSLNRQVQRNIARFPSDFMFQLTLEEFDNLRCQIGTSSWGGQRYLPLAFTEHGILMLSSVLRSPRAIQVNIQIMRAFVLLRHMMAENREIARKLDLIEKRVFKHDSDIRQLVRDIRRLTITKSTNKLSVGFLK